MAKDLYVSGNYIIAVNEDGYMREFPMGKTVYKEFSDKFEIIEGEIEGSEITIFKTDVANWVDDLAVAFSEATMRTFLRVNTGFNLASGGNGAELQSYPDKPSFPVTGNSKNIYLALDVNYIYNWNGASYDRISNYNTSQAYTETNVTTDRSFDANSITLNELADVVGTMLADLRSAKIVD